MTLLYQPPIHSHIVSHQNTIVFSRTETVRFLNSDLRGAIFYVYRYPV